MRYYSYKNEWQKLLLPDIVLTMSKIHEYKGEQKLYIESAKDTLKLLLDVAKIQSTESSNRIEGIHTSDERLKSLVSNKTTPRSRNEQEIAGYRDALTSIHESYDYIPLRPSFILQLHRDLYKYSGRSIGGKYKNTDNVITEENADGKQVVRFEPVPTWETPASIEQICDAFDDALNHSDADPLILIPMFILDFLCVHPFNDGNGRMSRLLTLLLLYRADYIVGKYISIERIIADSKETYYEALQNSSDGWHEERNDYAYFVRYMLGVILAAYREFSDRAKLLVTSNLSKPDRVREIIKGTIGEITKAEIMERCPDVSLITVQRTLNDLLKDKYIVKIGGGRYTKYVWNHNRENKE